MRRAALIATVLFLSSVAFAQNQTGDAVEVKSKGSYILTKGDSKEKARAVSLFKAKRNALESAIQGAWSNDPVKIWGARKDEILSLAAREIQVRKITEKWKPSGENVECVIQIDSTVRASDFIAAEILNQKLLKENIDDSFREEMEQDILTEIDPGKEIAKAYRFIRRRYHRMAVIYLDHLEKKYPNWDDIYMAKAIANAALDESFMVKEDLEKACRLGNKKACEDLKGLQP
ncbi:MAG: hypothetical protein ABII68_00830 [Pseudomonadota bacterium]